MDKSRKETFDLIIQRMAQKTDADFISAVLQFESFFSDSVQVGNNIKILKHVYGPKIAKCIIVIVSKEDKCENEEDKYSRVAFIVE